MNNSAFKCGSKLEIRNILDLAVFEEIYPYNEGTGRALYKVRDQKNHLFYALKTFDLECNDRREIEKEILSLNNFDLGNIAPKCRFFSVDQNQGLLIMDWFEGKTLAQQHATPPEDFYDLRSRVNLLQSLCFAVDKIHSKNIYHRDLKPENIILSSDRGAEGEVRLIDFGMSNFRRRKGNQSEGGPFRAPEQDGSRDLNLRAQVDIFAIGKIGWWLVTGKNPQLHVNDCSADWENLEGLNLLEGCPFATKSFETVLKSAMAYKPEKRYRNVRQFEIALKQCKLKEG